MSEAALHTPKECLERAVQFREDGKQLLGIGSQWYAVAYYGAYHMVRAALMVDPVFKDLKRLSGFGSYLQPSDAFTSRHNGRISINAPRTPGVNDLVREMYPSIAVQYTQLHGASVAVRYGLGLGAYDAAALVRSFDDIREAYLANQLVAA